jgi:hypothetical protein
MTNKTDNLENLLENLLKEADPIQRPQSMADTAGVEKKEHSLDQALDRYLVQYEREAIPTSEMYENTNLSKLTNYLFEQEEEAAADEEDAGDLDLTTPDTGGDVGPDVGGGGLDLDLGGAGGEADAAGEAAGPAVIETPKINLEDFARSVARLVNNVQSLIDLKSIVLNRAELYIRNNYNERTARELVDILDRSYDLKAVNQGDHHMTDANFPQPRTAVTGPIGG